MRMPFITCLAALAPASVVLAGPMTIDSITSTRPYAQERIALGVDPGKIAFFVEGLVGQAQAALLVEDMGLGASVIEPSTVPGWFYADITGSDSFSDRAISECLEELLRQGNVDFVSPVYITGSASMPWIPTRDVIIAFQEDVPREEALGVIRNGLQGTVVEESPGGLPSTWIVQTDLETGMDVLDVTNRLSGHGTVTYAETDAIVFHKHALIPNDPLFSSQWALNQSNDIDMDGPEAWDITIGDDAVVVVILDDGAQQGHPDLHQLAGSTFSGSGSNGDHYTECDGHGTCVSSCVASTINNATDVVGIAPNCYTRSGKIFNAISFFGFCLGLLESQDSWIVNGINWSATIGARATNSSWGGGGSSSTVNAAYANTGAQGVMHFAAAGNDGSSTIGWPANLAIINSVSAVSSNGSLASFSTYGSGLFVSAPGESILASDRTGADGFGNGNTVTIDGTSFSSPYAAGVAAMIFSMDTSLTVNEVKGIMEDTSRDLGSSGYDTSFGWGMVNAHDAVMAVDIEEPCPGDIDGDSHVGVDDLLALIAAWGPCTGCSEDLDGDDHVGVDDLLALIAAWGPCS